MLVSLKLGLPNDIYIFVGNQPPTIMYSSEDLERFYFQYQTGAVPHGMSLQSFCSKNNVLYNIFHKWYKDTRRKIVEVQLDGVPSGPTSESVPSSLSGENPVKKDSPSPYVGNKHRTVQRPEGASCACIRGANLEQWPAYPPKRSSLSGFIPSEPKTGGPMLSVTDINRFYCLRGFTDMRCKSLGMITQFQHLYFSDHMLATTIESGYYVPDIKKIVEAYGIRYFRLTETLLNDEELKRKIIESHNCLIEYVVEGITTVSQKPEYNQPIAKLSPQLPKEEYERWVMDENL